MTTAYEEAVREVEACIARAGNGGHGSHQAVCRVDTLRALLAGPQEPSDPVAWICDGCGRLARDRITDLAVMRAAGAASCCPERKIEPLFRSRRNG